MRFDGQASFPEAEKLLGPIDLEVSVFRGGGGGVKRLCGASGGMCLEVRVKIT